LRFDPFFSISVAFCCSMSEAALIEALGPANCQKGGFPSRLAIARARLSTALQ